MPSCPHAFLPRADRTCDVAALLCRLSRPVGSVGTPPMASTLRAESPPPWVDPCVGASTSPDPRATFLSLGFPAGRADRHGHACTVSMYDPVTARKMEEDCKILQETSSAPAHTRGLKQELGRQAASPRTQQNQNQLPSGQEEPPAVQTTGKSALGRGRAHSVSSVRLAQPGTVPGNHRCREQGHLQQSRSASK